MANTSIFPLEFHLLFVFLVKSSKIMQNACIQTDHCDIKWVNVAQLFGDNAKNTLQRLQVQKQIHRPNYYSCTVLPTRFNSTQRNVMNPKRNTEYAWDFALDLNIMEQLVIFVKNQVIEESLGI